MKTTSFLGIQVARLMNKGLVREARIIAGTRNSWTIPESRAILGVGREMTRRGWCSDGVMLAKSILGWI